MSTSTATDPNVFIIESLQFGDEFEERREGHLLYEMLHLAGKRPEYYYVRTRHELKVFLEKFHESGKRYLHISCHGYDHGLALTLAQVPFQDFGQMARPYMNERRLFLSACRIAKRELAENLMSSQGCYSIIGPTNNIDFDDAAIMWAAFYHLVFKDAKSMNRDTVSTALQKVCNAFGTSVRYFARSSKPPYFSTREFSRQLTESERAGINTVFEDST